MKKAIFIVTYCLISTFVYAYPQNEQINSSKTIKDKNTFSYLKKKMNLSLAVKGEALNTFGNCFVVIWNKGIFGGYEKDEEGNRITDENGDYIYKNQELHLNYLKNNIGGEIKLDYYLTPEIVVSAGINGTEYDKSFYGKKISNNGYFIETQIKTSKTSNVYFFGQFGRIKSNFKEEIELKHYQYATGLGIGNDYIGLDLGANFFSTIDETKQTFLEDLASTSPEQSYLESVRVMLRLTAKLF